MSQEFQKKKELTPTFLIDNYDSEQAIAGLLHPFHRANISPTIKLDAIVSLPS